MEERTPVHAILLLRVDTKRADIIAEKLSPFEEVEDLYVITGEWDIYLRAYFDSEEALSSFLSKRVRSVRGIRAHRMLRIR